MLLDLNRQRLFKALACIGELIGLLLGISQKNVLIPYILSDLVILIYI